MSWAASLQGRVYFDIESPKAGAAVVFGGEEEDGGLGVVGGFGEAEDVGGGFVGLEGGGALKAEGFEVAEVGERGELSLAVDEGGVVL
jgi:hypothetical protein